MRVVSDDLSRILSEVGNLSLKWLFFLPFLNFIQIDWILVCQRVENIHVLNGVFPPLFVSVDQVDPVMDSLRYILTL